MFRRVPLPNVVTVAVLPGMSLATATSSPAATNDRRPRFTYSAPMARARLALLGLCITACPGGTATNTSTAKTGEHSAEKSGAKTDPQPGKPAPPIASPAPTTGEDWLVWWFKDNQWRTRWLHIEADKTEVLGERQALVIGDGAHLWQVERADKRARVLNCECLNDPKSEFCDDRGHMPTLGLRARPLAGLEAVAIKEAGTETEYGDDFAHGLSIRGGAQATLLLEQSANGYFCGAHGSYGSSVSVFDVALGKPRDEPFKNWWTNLPEPLRRNAAEAIKEPLASCDVLDPDESASPIAKIMNELMRLDHATLLLDKGEPSIGWVFAADLPYVCSPDYQATGSGWTGLIPEAAPLGLAGPLPPAVLADLKSIGDADAFGFSRLTLGEPERRTTIASFTAIADTPWPKEEASDGDDAPAPANRKLEEGRKLSRAGDLPAAIAAFDEAIKLDPGLASAYSERGYARLRAGDHAAARTDCEKALGLETKPSFKAAVWYNLGLLAEAQKRPDEARAAYLKSQALRETKQVKAALEALDADKK